ncbi:MAG: EAL domain-containing protein [Thiohalomonadales bacterium]
MRTLYPISLLLVDDDEVDRLTIRRSLEKSGVDFELQDAATLSAGIEAVKTRSFECIIVDYRLPDGDGLLLLKMIKSLAIDTPVIALSGYGDEQLVVEMMRAGAADYVSKDYLKSNAIIKSVNTVIRVHKAEQERKLAEQKVKESNEFINNILESISDAFLAVNQDGEITYINKQAEMVLKEKREFFIGNKITDRLPKSEAWFHECIQETFDNNIPLHIEKYYSPLHSWLELNFYPAQDCVSIYFRDITARKNTEKLLDYLAKHDELTRLSNRFSFKKTLEVSIESAADNGDIIGLIYIDLDRFKLINDTLGHSAGDELLQSVSIVLRNSVKQKDTVARMGGDEFVILLTDLKHKNDAVSVARGIHKALLKPHRICGRDMVITSSLGVSVFPNDAHCAEDLINNADKAMYQVKRKGKNSVLSYSPLGNPQHRLRLDEESELRRAIESGSDIEIHYQPQIDSISSQIVGVEALVRWNHPEKGIRYPVDFIPLAEEIGIIELMGQWVLEQVILQRKRWLEEGLHELRVAVNVSHREFVCSDFKKVLLQSIDGTDMSSGWLELELTENIISEDLGSSVELLQYFQKMGIRIAMDDFGTGYSSLVYLRQFPLDTIKIDRSFTRDIGESDGVADSVVTAIIDLAHGLGIRVVAEGVEKESQVTFLKNSHCDLLQGFYLAPAMNETDFKNYYLQYMGVAKSGLNQVGKSH